MKGFMKKTWSVLLSVAMVVTMAPYTALPAQAATNLEGGFEGQDGDVFSALGFDTSVMPEGYDPDTADNPYGRDKVTGNQIFELAVAGQTGADLYGKNDNNVDPSTISGIPGGGRDGIGMKMFASAAGDFNGDGLPGEIVYVGFDDVPYMKENDTDVTTATLQFRIYDGQTETYGTIKSNLGEVTPYYTIPTQNFGGKDPRPILTQYDMNWQNLLQVTAGDYDGDGVSEIAVYVGENEQARVDVYKYQKTSHSHPGDWIDGGSWIRQWSHALNGEYAYVPNMVSLVSGDFNRDGTDDLGISYGSTVFCDRVVFLFNVVGRLEPSKAVMLWGNRNNMLQNYSPVDLADDEDELGPQARVSLTKGDLDGDGIEELIATGQPVEDLKRFKVKGVGEEIITGNTQRTAVTYVYDLEQGLTVNTSDLLKPVEGEYQTHQIGDDPPVTSWISGNGFDDKYYSLPYMRTNAAAFLPQGSDYPYLYLDSCIYRAMQGSLSLTGELDETKYDGDNTLEMGNDRYWGSREYKSNIYSQNYYAEYGAAAEDINGGGHQILVTGSYAASSERPSLSDGETSKHRTQYAVVKGNEEGTLTASVTNTEEEGHDYTEDYRGQALTFLDCDTDTVIMEYTGRHYLTYSDPKVLAVIAAAPYFEDVDKATGGKFAGENKTSWGESHGSGHSSGSGIDFKFGVWFENELLTASINFGIDWSLGLTLDYEHSNKTSHEYTMTFNTSGDQDAVAFFSVPTENYDYRIKTPNGKGGYDVTIDTVSKKYQPVYQVLTLDYYESIQGNYDALPAIAGKAITSTPGDPSSYPSSDSGYEVIAEWDKEAAGVGYGNGSIEQEISISNETEDAYKLGAEVEFKIGGGSKAQIDIGQSGWKILGGAQTTLNPFGSWANISMRGTTISGEVANMPLEFQQYAYYYNWKLFSYYYDFGDKKKPSSGNTDYQLGMAIGNRVPVISYIVNDVAQPPRLPEDFQQDYDRTTSDTNVLTWTYDEPAEEFIISKYYNFPVGGGLQEIARIKPGDATHFTYKTDANGKRYKEFFAKDTGLSPYTEYKYNIQVKRLDPVPPLSAPSAMVTARTKAADGYPRITITESDEDEDHNLLVYPDKNAYMTAVVTGPEGQKPSNYYSVVDYQWQKKEKGAWTDMSGETGKTLTFESAGVDAAGDYRCRVNVITKADNTAITAYSDSVTVVHSKRNSFLEELAVTDVVGGIQLHARVKNAHKDSASIPGGTVTFSLTSDATGKTYQYEAVLNSSGAATAVVEEPLPEGMYTVEAYYSGSFIFKSCSGKTLYLSQRTSGYDIDLPEAVTYGEEGEIVFREVSKREGITSIQNVDAGSVTMHRAAVLSRAAVSGAQKYTTGPVTKGKNYYYTDEDGIDWYFTAPVPGTPVFDTEHRAAIFGDDLANQGADSLIRKITGFESDGRYLVVAGTPAGDYLITMQKTAEDETAYGILTVSPREITLQIPKDLKLGESDSEPATDITFSQLSVTGGSWADCDMPGGELTFAGDSIGPKYYNTAGTEFTRDTVRHVCGAYSIVGQAKPDNYDITYRNGQLTILGGAFKVRVGSRPFAELNAGTVYMMSPEIGAATGELNSGKDFTKYIQAGSRMIFSAQPDEGYEIYDWYINGVAQDCKSGNLVYTMLAEDVDIEVQFAIKQNSLTFGVAGDEKGGTLTCSDDSLTSGSLVRRNSAFTFTAAAAEGYHFKEWRYTEQGKGTAYHREDSGKQSSTFDLYMPEVSCSLYAVFERDSYTFRYVEGNTGTGLTATCADDEGKTVTLRSGASVRGGTEITVAPAPGYQPDPSRQYVSDGTQGTADPAKGTYTLTLDQDTTVYGWTQQKTYDLTLGFDYTADPLSQVVPDASITYQIGDREYTFDYDPDAPSKVIEGVPGGTAVTVTAESLGWVDLTGWTASDTIVTAGTTKDPLAEPVVVGGTVKKDSSYIYNDGQANYYFVSPVSGTVKEWDKDRITLYSSSATYTLPALVKAETLTVALKEKPVRTVSLEDITENGQYSYTLPAGGFNGEDGPNDVKVHDGDDFTVQVKPVKGQTVSYWETSWKDGEEWKPVKTVATSLKYTIPSITTDFRFKPLFSTTTYNTVTWPTISESRSGLTLSPVSGYIASVTSGGDFKFTLSGSGYNLVDSVYANGDHEFTEAGNIVGGTTYKVKDGVYSIEKITENQEISVKRKNIGVTVDGTDISAMSGPGWKYDPAAQTLTLSRDNLVLSGSNDQTIEGESVNLAPALKIVTTEAVDSLTLEGLSVTSNSPEPMLTLKEDVFLTAAGKNRMSQSGRSTQAVRAETDLTVRGNGSLEVELTCTGKSAAAKAVSVEDDMRVTGTVNLQIRNLEKGGESYGLYVGDALTVGAEDSTASPTLRVSNVDEGHAAAYVGVKTVLYGGEASFYCGYNYGLITDGNVECRDGILDLFGAKAAFGKGTPTDDIFNPAYACLEAYYPEGYMCEYRDSAGSEHTLFKAAVDYSVQEEEKHDVLVQSYFAFGTIGGKYVGGSETPDRHIRLSPLSGSGAEDLTLSVRFGNVTYSRELSPDTANNAHYFYYIVPSGVVDDLQVTQDVSLLPTNAIVVAENHRTEGVSDLYFTQKIPSGNNNLAERDPITPLEYTLSGTGSKGNIYGDGRRYQGTGDIECIESLTLKDLILNEKCLYVGESPVILKGSNYLLSDELNDYALLLKNGEGGSLKLYGPGTLTIYSRNPAITAKKVELYDVPALTMNTASQAIFADSAQFFHEEDGTVTALPYGFGWLEDLGGTAGTAVTQSEVKTYNTPHFARFYVTSTDPKADPAKLIFDKSGESVDTITELIPPMEMGVPHLFAPGQDDSKVVLVRGTDPQENPVLVSGADYTYSSADGLISTLKFDYSKEVFSTLPVGEYTLRICFIDKNVAVTGLPNTFTLNVPLTVRDSEHSTGGLTATADPTIVTRGSTAAITTAFTGTTPKEYAWSLTDKDGRPITDTDVVNLEPKGDQAAVTIGTKAPNGSFTVRVASYKDSEKTEVLGTASAVITVVPKATDVAVSCPTETPSGDGSYMLNHNTLDGQPRSWQFEAAVTMDDGTTNDDVTWSLWGQSMSGTTVDAETGLLTIHPKETGMGGELLLTATHKDEDGTTLAKRTRIRLSEDAIVGYTDPESGALNPAFTTTPEIDADGTPVAAGTLVSFTANPIEDYAVETWTVNGKPVENGDEYAIGENTLSFTAEKLGRYNISATFSKIRNCQVTFGAEGPGTLTAETASGTLTSGGSVSKGTDVTFTAVPEDLAGVKKWTVLIGGEEDTSYAGNTDQSITLSGVSDDVDVRVEFDAPGRTFTVKSGENGAVTFLVNGTAKTVTPSGGIYLLEALSTDAITALAVPAEGYRVGEWTNLAHAAASDAVCTVLPGTEDASAEVSFEKLPDYDVTVYTNSFEDGWGTVDYGSGTVPMSGSRVIPVAEGGSLHLTAVPDGGSTLYDWQIQPKSYTDYTIDGNELILKNVRSEVTAIATFRRGNANLILTKGEGGGLTATYKLVLGEGPDARILVPEATLAANGSVTTRCGAEVDVTVAPKVEPNDEWKIASFTVNGRDEMTSLQKGTKGAYTYRIDALTVDTKIEAAFERLMMFTIIGHLPYTDPEDETTVIGRAEITEYDKDGGYNTETPAGEEPQKVRVTSDTAVEITFAPASEDYVVNTAKLTDGVTQILRDADSRATFSFKQSSDGTILRLEGLDIDLDFSSLPSPFEKKKGTQEYYTLNLVAGDNGTLTAENEGERIRYLTGASVPAGTVVTYRAEPKEHYSASVTLQQGEGEAAAAYTAGRVIMDANTTITAEFPQSQYPVTVDTTGKGGGTVTINDTEYQPGKYWFDKGESLTIAALADERSAVESFHVRPDPDNDAAGNPVTVVLNSRVEVTASFSDEMRRVTYNIPENGTLKVLDTQGQEIERGSLQRIGDKFYVAATPVNTHYKVKVLTVGDTKLATDYFTVDSLRGNDVYCEFDRKEVKVTWSTEHCTVTAFLMPDGTPVSNGEYVPSGSQIKFDVKAESDNYTEESFNVNGAERNSSGWYKADQTDIFVEAKYQFTGDGPDPTVSWFPTGCTIAARLADGTELTNGQKVPVGSRVKFTVTPRGTDYKKESFTVIGAEMDNEGFYVVGTDPVTASAVYTASGGGGGDVPSGAFVVNITSTGSGRVDVSAKGKPVSGGSEVSAGTRLTIQAVPEEGSRLTSLTVNGVDFKSGDEYVVYGNVLVKAVFRDEKTAAALPCYNDRVGRLVFIGFSCDLNGDGVYTEDEYIAPEGAEVFFRENHKQFEDMPGNWADEYIQFVGDREIFQGMTDTLFDPEGKVTRAMYVTVIGRLYERSYGTIGVDPEKSFTDCDYNSWYGKYVDWAAATGIVTGYNATTFGPGDYVTREQMAAILARFLEYLERKPAADGILDFTDADTISDWAVPGVDYCAEKGIIMGYEDGRFAPKDNATRAQIAAVVVRLIECFLTERA